MKLLGSKECINLTWLIIFRKDTGGYKDLRTNSFEEGEFDVENNSKSFA